MFFLEQKIGVLGVIVSRSRKSAAAIFFVAAEQPDLYADWVRSSSICFFDLRLDLSIILFTIFG